MSEPTIDLASDLKLPLDFATARVSLVGMSGAGKSNALAVMIEQCFLHGIPFTHVDPLGAAWGLRSSADGSGTGIAVPIFGGYHGDLPLRADAGALIARELYELDVSAVLDLSAFDPEEQTTFTKDLALAMLRLHQRKKKVRALFVDEAATLAPERKNSTSDNDCAVALWRIHTGGRALGIGLKTATQSSADQDKRTMKQSEIFVALRTASPLDQAPVLKYVKTSVDKTRAEQIAKTLASLHDGEAWFIAPRWLGEVQRSRFALRTTFDSSRTPRVGESIEQPKQLAKVDLERLRSALAAEADPDAVDRGDASVVEPLRARIKELEADVVLHKQKLARAVNFVCARAETIARDSLESVLAIRSQIPVPPSWSGETAPDTAPRGTAGVQTVAPVPQSSAAVRREAGDVNVPLNPAQQKIAEALAARFPLKTSLAQVGALSRYSPTGGAFRTAIKFLRDNGIVEMSGNQIAFTEAGRQRFGLSNKAKPKAGELRETLRAAMNGAERKIFDLIVERGGMTITDIGRQAGYAVSGGAFRSALKTLRDNECVVQMNDHVSLEASLR